MENTVYKLSFGPAVSMPDVETLFALSVLVIEDLHGETAARLDLGYSMDMNNRKCVIDARTPAGQNLSRVFVGMLKRDQGTDAFRVERIDHQSQRQPAGMAA